jgi:hypothetical protein
MRINPQTLRKIARDTVDRRTRSPRDLLAAYLCGSLVWGEPVLGGTADVDLVFVHNGEVSEAREIERLTDEVHLDISHHTRRDYRAGRKLRRDPWMGPAIYGCQILYDPQHYLDFTQASVRGHYHRADYVLSRVQSLAEASRDIWMRFYQTEPAPDPDVVAEYLDAVEGAVNAIASLTGPPMPERRLLLDFAARADAVGRPGLYVGALGLLGGTDLDAEALWAMIPDWERAYDAVGRIPDHPMSLHPHRRWYYLRAFEAMHAGDQPLSPLWPILHTWTEAVRHLPEDSPQVSAWETTLERLGLLGDGFEGRVMALDAYLDTVEVTIETWAREHGA